MLMSIGSRVFGFLSNVLSSGVRMSASPRLLGRHSGGAGAGEEIQLGAGFSFVGNTLTYTAPGGAATWGAITGTLSSQADLQAALNAKAASSHTHVSASITDSTDDGNANIGKLLRTSRVGLGPATITLGTVFLKEAYYQTAFSYGQIEGSVAGVPEFTGFFPGGPAQGFAKPTGTFPILPHYADATAAAAAVSIGDAWWDTTLNKARVRLT